MTSLFECLARTEIANTCTIQDVIQMTREYKSRLESLQKASGMSQSVCEQLLARCLDEEEFNHYLTNPESYQWFRHGWFSGDEDLTTETWNELVMKWAEKAYSARDRTLMQEQKSHAWREKTSEEVLQILNQHDEKITEMDRKMKAYFAELKIQEMDDAGDSDDGYDGLSIPDKYERKTMATCLALKSMDVDVNFKHELEFHRGVSCGNSNCTYIKLSAKTAQYLPRWYAQIFTWLQEFVT
jgi:hypothetical protein